MRVACVDLSAGGMAVIASRSPRRLERVRVHTTIGDSQLVGEALVVRGRKIAQGHLWGLRFVNLDEMTRANLQRFVQHQLSISARQRQAQLFTARIQQANQERDNAAARSGASPALRNARTRARRGIPTSQQPAGGRGGRPTRSFATNHRQLRGARQPTALAGGA